MEHPERKSDLILELDRNEGENGHEMRSSEKETGREKS